MNGEMRRELSQRVTSAGTWRRGFSRLSALLICLLGSGAPGTARAIEGDIGVSLGGMVAGSVPRFAISPHLGFAWRLGDHFRLGIHDFFSILPALDPHGIGIYNHLSGIIGLSWRAGDICFGPSFGLFSVPMCGGALCARLTGMAPGVTAEGSYYFAGPFGVSARLNIDWITGFGNVLPPGVLAVVVAGPVFHWGAR